MKISTGSLAIAAALLIAGPAFAETAPPPAAAPLSTTPANGMTGTKATGRFGWAGIGIYDFSGFAEFGLNVGAAVNVLPITPDLEGAVWGNAAIAFGSGTLFPLTIGGGVRYDKLPVQLFGGLGLTAVLSSFGTTPVGLDIMAMGLYPLPQVDPHLSAQGQISYNILSNGFSLFTLTAGVGYSF